MRIITCNVNGLRAAAKKGFFEWLAEVNPDVVCLQEIKIQESQLAENALFSLKGYYCEYHCGEKKGYSGVAIYAKQPPQHVTKKLPCMAADGEGRYLQFDYPTYSVASIYFPSGTSGEHRQAVKMNFLSEIEPFLKAIQRAKKPFILCGDYNIAHQKIDLKNWRANQTHTGFLPEERAWMDKLFGEFGFVDAFRSLYPEKEAYTWWSFRGRAFEKNVGWRIDYQVITPDLKPALRHAEVFRTPKFSDHAPLLVEYAL